MSDLPTLTAGRKPKRHRASLQTRQRRHDDACPGADPQYSLHRDGAPHHGDDAAMPRPLSLQEVAALFGRTPRTIRNWVRAGLLTPLPLPRGPYFSRKQILVLLESM